uniref:dynein regulatory complex subunit 3 n=1 Tax=Semicossyphus pulcher TaxID=241346 RepID=UPI0037E89321
MNKIYETMATLIDENMLKEAVMKLPQLPQDETARIMKEEGIHFDRILQLRLEYKDIPRIDYLWEFTSLVRLDINNNLIEKIEGLDHLLNLTWLNLSFNSLEKIEGLESLRKLEVLNLSNNRISVIENMDTLEKLTQFCIGNNLIGQLDDVLYLRRFKNLFSLNLSGNPASKEDDYKLFIAAYFPNLVFLDYKLLDKDTKKEAFIKYQYILEKMRLEELQTQQAQDAEQDTHDLEGFLNGSYLSKSMLKDDPMAETLRCMPEMAQHQMLALCTQIIEIGLAEHKRRETDVNSFVSVQTKAMKDFQQKVLHVMADFEPQHQERMVELQQLLDQKLLKDKISRGKEEIKGLCNSLMEMELHHVSQMEDIIKRLDNNLSDMVSNFSETVQEMFTQCRDLEDNYYENVQKVAVATLERVAEDDLEEDMPDDVKMLFTDRDAVMDALNIGHKNHLLMINDRETQLLTRVSAWKVALIEEIQDKELKWNRTRISDFRRYEGYLKEQLEELQ